MLNLRASTGAAPLARPAIITAPTAIGPFRTADRGDKVRLVRARTHDQMMTYDQATIDASGQFLIGELERLDPTLHQPLVSVTWSRDIDLRQDVTVADDVSSFTNSSFASPGGVKPTGKAWASKEANAITGVALDIGKTANPLSLWAMEVSYSIPELVSAQKLGRPVDEQKINALQLKHQMDTDEQVYIGDTDLGQTGLFNNGNVSTTNAANGGSGFSAWSKKTPDEIQADLNAVLSAAWAASGYSVMPDQIRVPPTQLGLLSRVVSSAGNTSLLEYLKTNTLSYTVNGRPLNIQAVKWLAGRGTSSTDRLVAYTKDPMYVRFPMTALQRTPLEYRSLWQLLTYWGRLGVVEFVYPETVAYVDGI